MRGFIMAGMLGHLLIISNLRDLACRIGAIAERRGFATRILLHTLDFEYVVQYWQPGIVALQVPMPDRQDIEVLHYLERSRPSARLMLLCDEKDKSRAIDVAQRSGLIVAAVLNDCFQHDEVDLALKKLSALERAA